MNKGSVRCTSDEESSGHSSRFYLRVIEIEIAPFIYLFIYFLMMTGYLLGRVLHTEAAWKSINFLGYETVKLNKSFISQWFTSNGNSKHPPPRTAFS